MSKYQSIENLNNNWGTDFNNFDTISINPTNYNWDVDISYADAATKNILPGRLDWINFKTTLLKSFIDDCASITHNMGFKIGLQIGSIYDDVIIRRGWFEITPLIENVDAVHVADIATYRKNFKFGADYLRSVCKYWENINGKVIEFTTESNWPGFNEMSSNNLTDDWTLQLNSYYDRGSTAHYVFGWDYHYNESLFSIYSDWRIQLKTIRNVKNIYNIKAVHLSCEFSNYYYNFPATYQIICSDTSRLLNSICRLKPYENNYYNYDDNCDIITNYMIKTLPSYLNNYNYIYLTKSSVFIPDEVYKNFMMKNTTFNLANATWFSDNGHGEYAYTHGLRNEYNMYRSPIHLIWRSRDDLMVEFHFPAINRSNSIQRINNLKNWALYYGSEESGEQIKEYPGWHIKSNGKYIIDTDLKKVWDKRIDLRNALPDGFISTDNTWNLIDWSMYYGYKEETILQNYNYWPYLGRDIRIQMISKFDDNYETSIDKNMKLIIYPNPVKLGQNVFIRPDQTDNTNKIIKLLNISGKFIEEYLWETTENQINTSKLEKGIYILILGDKRYKLFVQ